MNQGNLKLEQERIKEAYRRRSETGVGPYGLFAYENLAHMVRVQERHRETARLLVRHGFADLADLKILDVGCGDGNILQLFLGWGAEAENLAGIELLDESVRWARRVTPGSDIRCGDASSLPWEDCRFDLVCQHTVFTSILDPAMRQAVAGEMRRVLRPGGAILWYDFSYDNPRNPDVKGVKRREIEALFPGFTYHLRRITLAPPLARRLPNAVLPVLYPVLAMTPLLSASHLGLLIKPSSDSTPPAATSGAA